MSEDSPNVPLSMNVFVTGPELEHALVVALAAVLAADSLPAPSIAVTV